MLLIRFPYMFLFPLYELCGECSIKSAHFFALHFEFSLFALLIIRRFRRRGSHFNSYPHSHNEIEVVAM